MEHCFVLSVRFLDGRYHGQGAWPPDPARLFQALVAGASLGARLPEPARAALLWLEALPPPLIAAPPARQAKSVKFWVPNNDADATLDSARGGYAEAVSAVRGAKEERPWLFDAGIELLYVWEVPERDALPDAILDVAQGLYRLGRGTDPAFAEASRVDGDEARRLLDDYPGAIHRPSPGSDFAVPCIGTLLSLERRHEAFTNRFSKVGGQLAFRQPPKPKVRLVGYDAPPRRLLYQLRVAGSGAFQPWPLTGAAPLTEQLLTQAARRLVRDLQDAPLIERQMLGKGAGEAEKQERIRVLPLPSAGHDDADPSIRRLLVEVPANCPIPVRDLDWAFGMLAPHDVETGEIQSWRLERVDEGDPVLRHYVRASRRWRTITPMVLGYARGKAGRRAALEASFATILQALRHAGVRAAVEEIRAQPEPFHRRGVRAREFEAPERLKGQRLVHVDLVFAEPVAGPLVLGNGRYRGLGLFEPVSEPRDDFRFVIGGTEPLNAEAVVVAARRAIMARVRDRLGSRDLPTFFTGHEADGRPARTGRREHLAVLVDPTTRQLLVVGPHLLDHRTSDREEERHMTTLDDALSGFDRLFAGAAGAFDLFRAPGSDSALLTTSTTWRSVTDWSPCRHGRGEVSKWLRDDVVAECRLRGLPEPRAVEILKLEEGSRGGVRARLGIEFSVAVAGPIALGRTAMKGGGLFAAAG